MITIRKEQEGDQQAISALLLAAFANHPYSNQAEHLLVDALRVAKALTISNVALTKNGVTQEVIGHIAFSPAKINGEFTGWYTLAPLAVLPEHQNKGIGGALIEHGLMELKAMGATGCVLVGDPAYYNRFGFKSPPQLQAQNVPQEYLLAQALIGIVPQGEVTHHKAFSICE